VWVVNPFGARSAAPSLCVCVGWCMCWCGYLCVCVRECVTLLGARTAAPSVYVCVCVCVIKAEIFMQKNFKV